MLPVSAGFLAAWRLGGQRLAKIDMSVAGGPWVEVPAVDYQVDAARGERVQTRYAGTVTVKVDVPPLVKGVWFRIRDGFRVNGSPELVTVATLIATRRESSGLGAVTLSGFSVDRRIVRAEFRQPYYMPAQSGISALTGLLSVAGVPIIVDPRVRDTTVSAATFEQDRAAAASQVALALGAEWYGAADGTLRVVPVPTLTDTPVLTLNGVIIGATETESVEDLYNVVVVNGDRSDATVLPRGEWSDGNPYSPTYVGGPWGELVKTMSLPVMLTNDQCALAAQTVGRSSRGTSSGLDLTTVPACFLEPGDVVRVPVPEGSMETHILDQIPLHATGEQRLSTRSGEA